MTEACVSACSHTPCVCVFLSLIPRLCGETLLELHLLSVTYRKPHDIVRTFFKISKNEIQLVLRAFT